MASIQSKTLLTLLLSGCLFGLVACGGSSGGGSSATNAPVIEAQEEGDQGFYRVVLSPLNTSVAGEASGSVEIRISGDDFVVQSKITGAPAGVKHLQRLMTGTTCPDMSADKNGDGIIDVQEAAPFMGHILIPLDSNLSEQIAGMDFGPIANSEGEYVYKRSTTLSMLLSDLQAPDPDIDDNLSKLPAGDSLRLAGRVVMIHGVSQRAPLAETVKTVGDLSVAQSLPIACGKLVRIVSEESH